MPGRWACFGIVAFWLAMTGWLVRREWTTWFGSPPTLQAALEATAAEGPADVNWKILLNNQPVGRALTRIGYEGGPVSHYHLHQVIHLDLQALARLPLAGVLLLALGARAADVPQQLDLSTHTELTQDGAMILFGFRAALPRPQPADGGLPPDDSRQGPLAVLTLDGRPEGDRIRAHWRLLVVGQAQPLNVPPFNEPVVIPYTGRDLALGSLCPLDRLPNLRRGQTWTTPVIDSTGLDLLGGPLGGSGMVGRLLDRKEAVVRVAEEALVTIWNGEPVPCWIVTSDQEELKLRIWVAQDSGLVLKQEARWGKALHLVVERQPPPGHKK